ncbi:MAG: hypothetical protein HEP71_34625 [Roseivirga sp.]|nr:hypothetical protein [Roseivirga sp.]
MTKDRNKGITDITYNHLNLPVVVSFGSSKSITYTYDAAGIKLSKVVNDNGSLTTTDYAGGFIYENNALQHFAHEEGRVRKANNGDLVYDYFIKDHLGNTRMTLTEATEVVEYRASMETGTSQGVDMQSYEESLFLNLPAVRSSLEPLANTTDVPDIVDDKSARLNGYYSSTRIGPAKMMVVSAGDQINVSVDSYHAGAYSNTGYHNQTTIKSALSTVLGTSAANATEANGISSIVNGLSPASTAVFVGGDGTQNRPKAYLNVLIFDQDFNYEGGEYLQTDQASGYKTLTISKTMTEGGYVYVYLSNESQTDFNVYFDDLEIVHTKGAILQEDHYYPFGLTINALSSSAPLSKPNRFKYNGKSLQEEFNLNWYDYGARNYDAQLGRWFSVDPLVEKYMSFSSYASVGGNPINNLEIDGRYWVGKDNKRVEVNINKRGKIKLGKNATKDLKRMARYISRSTSNTAREQFEGVSASKSRVHFKFTSQGTDPDTYAEHKPHDKNGRELNYIGGPYTGKFDGTPKLIKDKEGNDIYAEATIYIYEGLLTDEAINSEQWVQLDHGIDFVELVIGIFSHETEHNLNTEDIKIILARLRGEEVEPHSTEDAADERESKTYKEILNRLTRRKKQELKEWREKQQN